MSRTALRKCQAQAADTRTEDYCNNKTASSVYALDGNTPNMVYKGHRENERNLSLVNGKYLVYKLSLRCPLYFQQ